MKYRSEEMKPQAGPDSWHGHSERWQLALKGRRFFTAVLVLVSVLAPGYGITGAQRLVSAATAPTSTEITLQRFTGAMQQHPKIAAGIAVYFVLLVLCTSLLLAYPLLLFAVNESLKPISDIKLPDWAGGVTISARHLVLVGFFHYHPRVLDAWVASHVELAAAVFEQKETVRERRIHIGLPVVLDGKVLPALGPEHLRGTFSRLRACLMVEGEGGSGKTSLACQIARWGMSKDSVMRLAKHAMLPILIDEDFSIENAQTRDVVIETIRGQLRQFTAQAEAPSREVVQRLVRNRRILVIVDGFSELRETTRSKINPADPEFILNALVVTSRGQERLPGVEASSLKPTRVRGDHLSSFMESYLAEQKKRELFDDPEFFTACSKLSSLVGERDITVLLARLYADLMIATKEADTESKLPENVPALMLQYLNELNRKVEGKKLDDRSLHHGAKLIAWECLKPTYRPAPVKIDLVTAALGSGRPATAQIEFLEDRIRLIQTIGAGKDRIRFVLDPLAEYLAALQVLDLTEEDKLSWDDFLKQADGMAGAPDSIRGFLLAVQDCVSVAGIEANMANAVLTELTKRTGADPQAVQRVRLDQRIKRLIASLSVPEEEDRKRAARDLQTIGRPARAAFPFLVRLLEHDPDPSVRWASADALTAIKASVAEAISALVGGVDDPEANVRHACIKDIATFRFLAGEAVPALRGALKNDDWFTRLNAAKTLAAIGPNARAAVPELIAALQNPQSSIGEQAAEALGQIGPEARTAIPALLKATENEKTRDDALQALGRIGVASEEVISVLSFELREVRDIRARLMAIEALGRLGPPAREAMPLLAAVLLKREEYAEFARQLAVVALTAVSTGSRDKDTVQALTNVLEDPDEEIRWKAAEGLRQVGSTDSLPVPALRKSLADSSPVVRMAAIGALGRIDPQATQTVSEYIKAHSNEHTLVRVAAQEALGADSLDAMIPELTGLLTDPADEKWRERFSATEALGRMQAKAKSAIPVLTKIAQNDRYHRVSEAAIASLKSITGSEKLPDEVFFRWSDS